ncbi:MAG: outer membrane lipoprotein chaperone LolA [Spongiibacteraceae bacterium]
MRNLSGKLSAAVFLLAGAYAAQADDAAVQKLGVKLEPLAVLQAQFVQTVSDDKGKILQTSEGTLAVKRVNRLRWETTSPFAYLIVTDGKILWRYDRDLEQATKQAFSGELADAPALILSGDMVRIRARYDVKWEQGSAGEWFTLVPKAQKPMFRELKLLFSGGGLAELDLIDNLAQRTEIRFSAVKVNPTLPDTLFNFTPPVGVDVVVDEH